MAAACAASCLPPSRLPASRSHHRTPVQCTRVCRHRRQSDPSGSSTLPCSAALRNRHLQNFLASTRPGISHLPCRRSHKDCLRPGRLHKSQGRPRTGRPRSFRESSRQYPQQAATETPALPCQLPGLVAGTPQHSEPSRLPHQS